jgi:Tfp pilus assembly protein PilO
MAYKGGKREKATLLYEKEIYTPEGAKTLSDKELRKEYTRLRSIARKRLERFEGTEWTDTQVYQLNAGVYKPLKEIRSDRELRHLFSDVARFVTADTSSVSGLEKQRATAVKTLNERGYDFVNKENYRQFAEFMEYARIANMNRMYDSKRVADQYNNALNQYMSKKELYTAYRAWSRKQKKLKKIQNINPRNSSMYRREIKP